MSNQDPAQAFQIEKAYMIDQQGRDQKLRELSLQWNIETAKYKYTYHFSSLGRPIIQFPQDMVALQELIWSTRPDLIIETGIAHGGSLILSASMLAMLDYCDAVETGTTLDPKSTRRRVLGVDIDIRAHNRAAIEAHPMSHRIDMIEGSSIASEVIAQIHAIAGKYENIMVLLDSNHTHDHVLAELEAYAPLTTKGNYCIVFDTIVEDMPEDMFPDRPWAKGDNPKTAIWAYMKLLRDNGRKASDGGNLTFEIDRIIENKLMITVAPNGYLKRIS